MGYGIVIKVWGDYALFTRPEMKVERVSYDVMTPSAARGILEAIYFKPQIRWVIDEIHVINPIKFENIRRNEILGVLSTQSVSKKVKDPSYQISTFADENRSQRSSLVLKNVCYYICAHFEMTGVNSTEEDTPQKHYNIALRRARNGQCFHRPYFGCREFPVQFEWTEKAEDIEKSFYIGEDKDVGYMLWDLDFSDKKNIQPLFFRPEMKSGVIHVPDLLGGDGK